eukprot:767371-Prorocentrum_minimum.AAC.3
MDQSGSDRTRRGRVCAEGMPSWRCEQSLVNMDTNHGFVTMQTQGRALYAHLQGLRAFTSATFRTLCFASCKRKEKRKGKTQRIKPPACVAAMRAASPRSAATAAAASSTSADTCWTVNSSAPAAAAAAAATEERVDCRSPRPPPGNAARERRRRSTPVSSTMYLTRTVTLTSRA